MAISLDREKILNLKSLVNLEKNGFHLVFHAQHTSCALMIKPGNGTYLSSFSLL